MLLTPPSFAAFFEKLRTLVLRGASASTGEIVNSLEAACLKTIAAFLNSRFGGTLLIGVADDGSVHGLESDYASLHKEGKADRDRFELHWNQLLINSVGEAAASNVTLYFHTVKGHDLCRVHVPASAFPVNATIKLEKNGQMVKTTAFFVRIGNGTREIKNESEKLKYIAARWGS